MTEKIARNNIVLKSLSAINGRKFTGCECEGLLAFSLKEDTFNDSALCKYFKIFWDSFCVKESGRTLQ